MSRLEPVGESYYRAVLMVGAAAGESPEALQARLQAIDRSRSLYKMWQMNDVVEAAQTGDRAKANQSRQKSTLDLVAVWSWP